MDREVRGFCFSTSSSCGPGYKTGGKRGHPSTIGPTVGSFSDHGPCLRLVCPVLHIPPGATNASRPTGCLVSD